jgi:DNA invertase Pin-like site-specific DNA recombinase
MYNCFLAFASPKEWLETVRVFQARSIALHVVDFANGEPLEPTAFPVELIVKVVEGFRAFERKVRSEAIRMALLERKLKGCRYTRCPGYGFRWVGRKGQQRRVPDLEERTVIRRLNKWRSMGYSLNRIYSHLLRIGVKKRDGQPWSRSRINRVLDGA